MTFASDQFGTQTVTVELTSNQSIATVGATVTWDQIDVDSDAPSNAWNSTNGDRIVAWRTGWYIAIANLEWETTATADRWIVITSGSKSYGHQRFDVAATNFQPAIGTSAAIYLNAGDYIQIYAGHDDGVNRNLISGSHTRASMILIR